MPRSVLLMLSQLPQDPTSGAARSLRTMCEWLASAGFRVAALGTTATDHASGNADVLEILRGQGLDPSTELPSAGHERPVHRFASRGVECVVLDTGPCHSTNWFEAHNDQYDRLLKALHHRYRFDVCLTMGSMIPERGRQAWLRERGCIVVLGVRQHGYYHPAAFVTVDDALMPSAFLVECYRKRVGITGTALPMPIELEDVIPPERRPMFTVQVNPNPEKGLFFLARLADELSCAKPDFPLLIVESRGGGTGVIAAGRAGGLDLARHANIMVSPGVPRPRDFLAATRVLLAPSVWEEPSGRVAAEAMLCGIPPVVSDRGGLPETVGEHGFVLPLPADLTEKTRAPVAAGAVQPWVELLLRLHADADFYADACARAAEGGRAFRPEVLRPRYVEYFTNVRRKEGARHP